MIDAGPVRRIRRDASGLSGEGERADEVHGHLTLDCCDPSFGLEF